MTIIAIGVLMEPMEDSALSTGAGSRQPVRPKSSAISAETTPGLTSCLKVDVAAAV